MVRYANSGDTSSSSMLTTKDVTKITDKIFKVLLSGFFVEKIANYYGFQGLKGIENVFTQHTTVLKDIIDNLIKGRLTEDTYPAVGGEPFSRYYN